MTDDRHLKQFWDASRTYYDQAAAANPEATPERRLLLDYLAPGQRLLDLGCGSCENALWIPAGCRYVGTDVSTVALVMAGEAGRPGARLRSDAVALPFAEGSFDAVLSTFVLEHLHDPAATFLEASRVLADGGLLLLVGSAWDLPYELPPSLEPRHRRRAIVRRLGRQLATLLDRRHRFDIVTAPQVLTAGYEPDADAVYAAQSWQLARYLEAIGLEIVEQRSLAHGADPPGPRAAWRWLLRRLPPWRHAWGNTLIVARRSGPVRPVSYRLLALDGA